MATFNDADGLRINTSIHGYTQRLVDESGTVGDRDHVIRLETTQAGTHTLTLEPGKDGQRVDVNYPVAFGGATITTSGLAGGEFEFNAAGQTLLLVYDEAATSWRKRAAGAGDGGGGGPVTSVFGRTGDVFAASGDYSGSLVTNDSAVPGASITDALNALQAGESSSVTRLLSSNSGVMGGETDAEPDPNGLAGFYFKNTSENDVPGRKVNYYAFAAEGAFDDPAGVNIDFSKITSLWADIQTYAAGAVFLHIYTKPEGDGNDAAGWYRTRYTYEATGGNVMPVGARRILWALSDPSDKYPLVKRLECDAVSSVGPAAGTEKFLFAVLSTSTGNPAGTVEFTAQRVGMMIDGKTIEAELVAHPDPGPASGDTIALQFGAENMDTPTNARWLYPGHGVGPRSTRIATGPLPAGTLKRLDFAALTSGADAILALTVEVRPPGGPWSPTALTVNYDQNTDDVVGIAADVAIAAGSMIAVTYIRDTNSSAQPVDGTATVLMEVA